MVNIERVSQSTATTDEIKAIVAAPPVLTTPLTKTLKIAHPVLLAGMNQAAGPELAAAVSNAGGLGVIGGVMFTPKMLKEQIDELKANLREPDLPWGVDLLLPQVGGNARKTNKDYTQGKLDDLISVVVEAKCTVFVSAVGIPPRHVVDRLHGAGILLANVIGHPKHVAKALDAGTDFLIAQGGEAGGHTGDVPSSILIPRVVDLVRGRRSPLTGEQVQVVAAGGIYNGRGLAAALCHGAAAVWVGTRFVCAREAGAPRAHQEAILKATHESLIKTTIFTGRPLRIINTPYIQSWEDRPEKIKELLARGVVPIEYDLEQGDDDEGTKVKGILAHWFAGHVAAVVDTIKPAKDIVDEMVQEAAQALQSGRALVVGAGGAAKL
ncbi:2-nitropropane dioxygenase [Acaromyces ingoldii]|uniref:2-nitropropane dioxygenase n=1 Tax=Acaromyces ingoldii TaxID=215250 RepID=A0A316YKI8_9BASI|nr:2-nitropropane dioxygenase [Acaromyces ingoldii]PWN89702.1 2-nitropropane dioxygenase [Acaromyces ingoldii]